MKMISPLAQGTMLVIVLIAAAAAQAQTQRQAAACPAGYAPFTGKDYADEEARKELPELFRGLPLMLGTQGQGLFSLSAALKITHDKGRLFLQGRGQQMGFSAGMESEIERLCYTSSGRFIIQLMKARGETQRREYAGRTQGNSVFLTGLPNQNGEVQLAKLTSASYNAIIGRIPLQQVSFRGSGGHQ